MSKSMWIPTEGDNLPVKVDAGNSRRVIFWVEDQSLPYWGFYSYDEQIWHNLLYSTNWHPSKVKYFAYVDNPYK